MKAKSVGLAALTLTLCVFRAASAQNLPPGYANRPGFPRSLAAAGYPSNEPVWASLGLGPGKSIVLGTSAKMLYVVNEDGNVARGLAEDARRPGHEQRGRREPRRRERRDRHRRRLRGRRLAADAGRRERRRRPGVPPGRLRPLDRVQRERRSEREPVPSRRGLDARHRRPRRRRGQRGRVGILRRPCLRRWTARRAPPKPGWPLFLRDTIWSSPVLYDLDGNGSLEIIIGTDTHLEDTAMPAGRSGHDQRRPAPRPDVSRRTEYPGLPVRRGPGHHVVARRRRHHGRRKAEDRLRHGHVLGESGAVRKRHRLAPQARDLRAPVHGAAPSGLRRREHDLGRGHGRPRRSATSTATASSTSSSRTWTARRGPTRNFNVYAFKGTGALLWKTKPMAYAGRQPQRGTAGRRRRPRRLEARGPRPDELGDLHPVQHGGAAHRRRPAAQPGRVLSLHAGCRDERLARGHGRRPEHRGGGIPVRQRAASTSGPTGKTTTGVWGSYRPRLEPAGRRAEFRHVRPSDDGRRRRSTR